MTVIGSVTFRMFPDMKFQFAEERHAHPPVSERGQIEHVGVGSEETARDRVPLEREGFETMGLFTRDIKTMNDLFVHQLQDIYSYCVIKFGTSAGS